MAEGNGLITKGLRVRLRFATDERLVASVRQGDSVAFEALYERHVGELLSFCVYMLGSRQDAEDAVQATFASAYRALCADRRRIALRPWLFTIARNEALSILRSRRPTVELNGEPALSGDPLRELEVREQVRHMLEDLRKLPESQRAALVLAEMHGLSQTEIGTVLSVRPDQVKAFIFQARSNLLSERHARETDCREIREELATARGASLLRGRLRRHLRSCQDCRVYADGVARQRRQLGAMLPLAAPLALKYRAVRHVLESGLGDPAPYAGGAAMTGSVVGAAVELAGGGVKAAAVKVAAGVACICASVGMGASVLDTGGSEPLATGSPRFAAGATTQVGPIAALAMTELVGWAGPATTGSVSRASTQPDPATLELDGQAGEAPAAGTELLSPGGPASAGSAGAEASRKSDEHSSQSAAEHRSEREAVRQKREEGQREREEAQRLHEEETTRKQEARQQAREEKEATGDARPPRSEEERQRDREARQIVREEKGRVRDSRPPPSEEELQRKHEERQRLREERERVGNSPPPPSEEELQRKHEERKHRREERQQSGNPNLPPGA
ncbi:MAG TPA: sigma-70 family RNA polymerase sigma factor [Solirubrobacteraceae bacterium]|nr:sigma-70 family RNA polymerase sigma factor [Solirubrobacteraceae bacterium]